MTLWGILIVSSSRILASDAVARLETAVVGLSQPVFVTHAGDGSGRLFIVEQRGRIRVVNSGQLLPAPFLDISSLVDSGGEKGLLGLAFHPNFRDNRRFFVNYTRSSAGRLRTVVAEYRVSNANPDIADPNELVILEFAQPFENHNGGMLVFGPDGHLYIGAGDGGSSGDPQNNGQRTDTLLGKVLRIDVDSAAPYAIPPDNPLVGRAGARGEIWAYGLRNPWRFSFDRLTGRLFLGDVGQNSVEEIDLIVKGGNYGWRIMEGSSCFSPPVECDRTALILPIADYKNPDEGRSVTGGYVYRGLQETSLKGAYIFGDYLSSRIWSLVEAGAGDWKRTEILKPGFSISSFGEDEQGELYVVNYGGSVQQMLFGRIQIFPQVADGDGYTTTLTVSNTSRFTAQGTLRFFDPDGTPRPLTLTGIGTDSSFPVQVPPGGTRVFQTSGAGPNATTGMALLETAPAVGAVTTFRLSRAGRLSALAGVLSAGFASRVTLPVKTTPPTNTGVAVANPGSFPVNVHLVLLDRDGNTLQAADLPELNPLPARAQVALLVTEMGFQNAAGLTDASLQLLVQGPGEVGVAGLIVEEGLLSVIPVIPSAR